jgi:hypothetical protein
MARRSASATGCAGARMAMDGPPPATAAGTPGARSTMTVRGPGQNAFATSDARSGHDAASARACASPSTCAMSG